MATPSTNEVLFVVIVVILFFIVLGAFVFCIYKATGPRKNDQYQQQNQVQWYSQQHQYITASQLESMRPPELALHLNSINSNRRSMFDKLTLTPQGVVRPSSTRPPSFLPMQHQAIAARDAQIAAMVAALPPPSYGDYRGSVLLGQSSPVASDEKR